MGYNVGFLTNVQSNHALKVKNLFQVISVVAIAVTALVVCWERQMISSRPCLEILIHWIPVVSSFPFLPRCNW